MTDRWELCLDASDQGGNATVLAPQLCVALLTYKRTEMAVRTVKGIVDNLIYPKELVSFYVADDGSPWPHMDAIFSAIKDGGLRIAGYHNEKFSGGTPYCGIGWNVALRKSHMTSDYVLWLEDDWVLKAPLDIRPFIWMLLDRKDVGMVRLSGLAIGNIVEVKAHRGVHYLDYLRSAQFAYSGNPHIRHIRFDEYYGLFATNLTPGDLEVHYDDKFRHMLGGPAIWRPSDIPGWGIFNHIGRERTW